MTFNQAVIVATLLATLATFAFMLVAMSLPPRERSEEQPEETRFEWQTEERIEPAYFEKQPEETRVDEPPPTGPVAPQPYEPRHARPPSPVGRFMSEQTVRLVIRFESLFARLPGRLVASEKPVIDADTEPLPKWAVAA